MMEDSCGPRKRLRALADADIEIATSSKDPEGSTGNVQNVHLPHLAVGKILAHLEFEDLLQCSSVNKIWNHEARWLLREKYQCTLSLNLDRKSAKDIREFKKSQVTALPVPYVSLSIKMRTRTHARLLMIWSQEVERAQMAIEDIILRAGPFQVVQLDIKGGMGGSFKDSVIWTVLKATQKTMTALKIKNLDGAHLFYNVRTLPQLTKLEIDLEATINERDLTGIQNYVQYSEKLETVGLMSARWLQILQKLPSRRILELVKEFTCDKMVKYYEEAEKFAALEPKLEKLLIPRNHHFFHYQNDRSIFISKSLLFSSQASVIELRATYEMLQEIRREKPSASFVSLRYLTVDLPFGMKREGLDRNEIIIALCPKLEKLEINTAASLPTVYSSNRRFIARGRPLI